MEGFIEIWLYEQNIVGYYDIKEWKIILNGNTDEIVIIKKWPSIFFEQTEHMDSKTCQYVPWKRNQNI